jgi:hypothetical protein
VIRHATTWRVRGSFNIDGADFDGIDVHCMPHQRYSHLANFVEWRNAIAGRVPAGRWRDMVIKRLAVLDPEVQNEPVDGLAPVAPSYWKRERPEGKENGRKRAAFLGNLACLKDSAPYVARGLVQHHTWFWGDDAESDDAGRKLFADHLRKGKSDPVACPGVIGFTARDWDELNLKNTTPKRGHRKI